MQTNPDNHTSDKDGLSFKEIFLLIIGIIISILISIYFPLGEIWVANKFVSKQIPYTMINWAYFATGNGIITFIVFCILIHKSEKENERINNRSI